MVIMCCREMKILHSHNQKGLEWSDGWCLNGCCGGGCYVLIDMKFCPFCGGTLTPPDGP